MALDFYMAIEGTQQKFPGTSLRKGHESEIPGFAWTSLITSPRDAATGLASGKRVHSPFKVVTETGKASPLFLQAICTNELLKSVTLNFWRPYQGGTTVGTETNFFTIKLTNATVSSMRQIGQLNKDPILMKYAEFDEIEFSFEGIEWQYKGTDGNIMTSDSVWGAKV